MKFFESSEHAAGIPFLLCHNNVQNNRDCGKDVIVALRELESDLLSKQTAVKCLIWAKDGSSKTCDFLGCSVASMQG